jgi:hypothetical protein
MLAHGMTGIDATQKLKLPVVIDRILMILTGCVDNILIPGESKTFKRSLEVKMCDNITIS